jgi:hypothetical protein
VHEKEPSLHLNPAAAFSLPASEKYGYYWLAIALVDANE